MLLQRSHERDRAIFLCGGGGNPDEAPGEQVDGSAAEKKRAFCWVKYLRPAPPPVLEQVGGWQFRIEGAIHAAEAEELQSTMKGGADLYVVLPRWVPCRAVTKGATRVLRSGRTSGS